LELRKLLMFNSAKSLASRLKILILEGVATNAMTWMNLNRRKQRDKLANALIQNS